MEGSTNSSKPIFNLEYLDGPYGLSECNAEEKAAFADTAFRLSRLTWGEIQRAPRHGLGHETITHHAIRGVKLHTVVTAETTLLAFRFSGHKAMVGFREGRVFVILYLDRDFTLYNHGG